MPPKAKSKPLKVGDRVWWKKPANSSGPPAPTQAAKITGVSGKGAQKRWHLEWNSMESNFPNQIVPGIQLSREPIGLAISRIDHFCAGPRITPAATVSAAAAISAQPAIIGDPTGVDPIEEVDSKVSPGSLMPFGCVIITAAAEGKSDRNW